MGDLSYLTDLSCSSCNRKYLIDQIQTYCRDCKAPLLAGYDFQNLSSRLDRDQITHRSKNMWRWHELLPVFESENIVTLGEGDTPLIRLDRLGSELGVPHLYLKEEGLNPTGSFKARGISCAVSKAHELGIKKLVIPSAGNAGGALAAYAARAAMESAVIMPKTSPRANLLESQIMGSSVITVDGLIDLAGKAAEQLSKSEGWFNVSTFKEPYRVEGKKIMGFEIAESLGWKLPDVIIYPTGGGTGLVGMWKAFNELKSLGWLKSGTMPRMIAVQADGCSPVVKAIETNTLSCERWENAQTIATGLCVPKSFADRLVLRYIRDSGGTGIRVSDQEIINWQKILARSEGIFSCPEGAATLAGLVKLLEARTIDPGETIVIFNTAAGIKYINL